jgi:hypothetical protein
VVDTHFARLAGRFGWTAHTDLDKIEHHVTGAAAPAGVDRGAPPGDLARPPGLLLPQARLRRMQRARWCPSFGTGPTGEAAAASSSRPLPFRDRIRMLVCPLALPGGTNRSGDVGPAVAGQPWNMCCGRRTSVSIPRISPRLRRRRPGGSQRQVRKTTEEACHAIPSAGPLDDPYESCRHRRSPRVRAGGPRIAARAALAGSSSASTCPVTSTPTG